MIEFFDVDLLYIDLFVCYQLFRLGPTMWQGQFVLVRQWLHMETYASRVQIIRQWMNGKCSYAMQFEFSKTEQSYKMV